jgi:hypothetical protein
VFDQRVDVDVAVSIARERHGLAVPEQRPESNLVADGFLIEAGLEHG